MSRESSLADTLRQTLVAVLRTLADRPQLEIAFRTGAPTIEGDSIQLPEIATPTTSQEVTLLRSTFDTVALRLRYSDADLHNRCRPTIDIAGQLFDDLENLRVTALGTDQLYGLRANFLTLLWERPLADGIDGDAEKQAALARKAIALLVYEQLIDPQLPAAIGDWLQPLRADLEQRLGSSLRQLSESVHDQRRFAAAGLALIAGLGFQQPDQDLLTFDPYAEDGDDYSAIRQRSHRASTSPSFSRSRRAGEVSASFRQTTSTIASSIADDGLITPWDQSYRVYTKAFDRVVRAETLIPLDELRSWRAELDQSNPQARTSSQRFAHRLQRFLLGLQRSRWEFDLDEGVLDAGRLARVVASPWETRAFKWEQETPFPDAVVALLIDNSGSMAGERIALAALCAEVLAKALERCKVKSEILGYTTGKRNEADSFHQWSNTGESTNPGRLGDLLHVVYKSADTPFRRARAHLGLMIKKGFLQDNVDGEALLWGHQRLLARRESKRILMVISDGAPYEKHTLRANGDDYLRDHLLQVAHWIDHHSPVEVVGIGIKHDVTGYYRQAITITDPQDLGEAMFSQLFELFKNAWAGTPPSPRQRGRRVGR